MRICEQRRLASIKTNNRTHLLAHVVESRVTLAQTVCTMTEN